MKRLFAGTLVLAGVASAALSAPAAAANEERSYGYLDLFAVQDQERVPDRKLGFGGRIGVGMPIEGTLALEAGLFANPINRSPGSKGDQQGLMLDLVKTYMPDASIRPFVFAGVGGVRDRLFSVDDIFFTLEAGLGAKMTLTDKLDLRASVSMQNVSDNNFGRTSLIDYRFNVGLGMPFGEAAHAPAAPAKVVDSDGDGIPDSQDRCPNAAAATADGCPAPVVAAEPPKDSDGDGVTDDKDACPGTLAGAKVDARGCVVEAASIVLKGVTFKTGSAELTADAKQVLDKAATSLAGQPDMKVEVGGHTDSMGDAKKNTALSQARADAVRKYLVGKGIDAKRLTAKGYGPSQPIADNKTKAGRAENRRVELKVVQ